MQECSWLLPEITSRHVSRITRQMQASRACWMPSDCCCCWWYKHHGRYLPAGPLQCNVGSHQHRADVSFSQCCQQLSLGRHCHDARDIAALLHTERRLLLLHADVLHDQPGACAR